MSVKPSGLSQGGLRVFFSAGEPSGDEHAAGLLRSLRRLGAVEAMGLGGPRLQQAGCRLLADMSSLAVMWFARTLWHLPKFYRLFRPVRHHLHRWRPDVVVLVDYPGFNWHVARAARELGIPVAYFCPPQVWAWAQWRVAKMRRWVDRVLCCLPFEQQWYSQHGCDAVWVGHPYFDHLRETQPDEELLSQLRQGGPVLALLPGSRLQEVKQNFPWLLQSAQQVQAQCPQVQVVVGAYGPAHAQWVHRWLRRLSVQGVRVLQGHTVELIQSARVALAVSGSVSLELMYFCVPSVILYRVSPLAWWVQHRMKRVRYITLVNLLACENPFLQQPWTYWPREDREPEVPFPEYLCWRNPARSVAGWAVRWLQDAQLYHRQVAWLGELKRRWAQGGACTRAAQHIWQLAQAAPRSAVA